MPLGDTDWRVWRWGLLRGAGFPVSGLDRLSAAGAAAAADRLLAGDESGRERFDLQFDQAVDRCRDTVRELAADPAFREAVIWQNPALARTMLDPVLRAGPEPRRNASWRGKEASIARYWSRYCAKNDTIGFFGPVCWVRVDGTGPAVSVTPGPALVRDRVVSLEWWALTAFGRRLAEDPQIRRWLPPKPLPTLHVDGRQVRHTRGVTELTRTEAALVARCDGVRPAVQVVAETVADPDSALRREADGFLLLDALVAREILQWGVDLPITLEAEAVLRRYLEGIGDPAARQSAADGYAALVAARDEVARAAGDPDALLVALGRLDETFRRVTGQEPTHAAGQMYAGRTVCFEDTSRDLELVFGSPVLDAIGPPLALLLAGARWLSSRITEVYLAELRGLFDELAAGSGSTVVPLAELWFFAQGLFFGAGDRPVDAVAEEFTRTWAELLGLDTDARELRYTSAELADAVARAFPATEPGWSFARYHSPDVHIVAPDADAVARGEFTAVLGELHAAWNTVDSEFFVRAHPDPPLLTEWQRRDVPVGRLLPLLPESWPRLTARTCAGLRNADDLQLGFVVAPGAEPARLLSTAAFEVSEQDGELVATTTDGRCWPLTEVFGEMLATQTVDAFKLLGAFRHSARVTIDRMVVARETWRRTVGELAFRTLTDERQRYLAVRRWRAELGLPERVFVKIDTEVKPIYVDLTSPVYVNILCTALRAGDRDGGPDTAVVISEMVPAAAGAWVPDHHGDRYTSELRLQVVDPRQSRWAAGRDRTNTSGRSGKDSVRD